MPMRERYLLFMKLIEIIMLIKLKGIRLNAVWEPRGIIKIYFRGDLIVKNLIIF
jgi:hypothetical protein